MRCEHCASTDGARRAQNCALYTSVCFVVFVPLFAMCSSMFMLCVKMYAVCRSHLCIVNVREYEVQDTFPLHFPSLFLSYLCFSLFCFFFFFSCSFSYSCSCSCSFSSFFSSHHQTLCKEPINQQISRRSNVIWHTAAAQHQLLPPQHLPTNCTESCHVCDGSFPLLLLFPLLLPPSLHQKKTKPQITGKFPAREFISITVLKLFRKN